MTITLRTILLASLLVLVGLVISPPGPALADGGGDLPPAQDCAECHPDQVADWLTSSHRLTLYSVEFQNAWDREHRSADCLTCHTTAYDVANGPDYWGITCAACHTYSGEAPEEGAEREHDPMSVPETSEGCATCHTGGHTVSYTEWETSPHNGYRPAECYDCHDSHSITLAADDTTTLCGSCHFEPVPRDVPYMHYEGSCTNCHAKEVSVDNVHMHGAADAVATCTDCHMRFETDFKGYPTQTGHLMDVSLMNCVACHGELHEMQPHEQ
jgi:hypothetical protein